MSEDNPEVQSQQREVYNFDPELFDAKIENEIARFVTWSSGESIGWDPEEIRKTVRTLRIDGAQDRLWAEHFSGKIPKDWVEPQAGSGWHVVLRDIKDMDTELSDYMIEAAIAHPIGHVSYGIGMHRQLTDEQLTRMEMQGSVSANGMQEIRDFQASLHSSV